MSGVNVYDQKRTEMLLSKLKIERLEGLVKTLECQDLRQAVFEKKHRDYMMQHAIFADETNVNDFVRKLDKEEQYNAQLAVFTEKQKAKQRARAMSIHRDTYFKCINEMLNNKDIKTGEAKNQQLSPTPR